jgi:hypothetical protein
MGRGLGSGSSACLSSSTASPRNVASMSSGILGSSKAACGARFETAFQRQLIGGNARAEKRTIKLTVLRLFGPGASSSETRRRRLAIFVRGLVVVRRSAARSSVPSSSWSSGCRSALAPGWCITACPRLLPLPLLPLDVEHPLSWFGLEYPRYRSGNLCFPLRQAL